jgi:hypothetical protein
MQIRAFERHDSYSYLIYHDRSYHYDLKVSGTPVQLAIFQSFLRFLKYCVGHVVYKKGMKSKRHARTNPRTVKSRFLLYIARHSYLD